MGPRPTSGGGGPRIQALWLHTARPAPAPSAAAASLQTDGLLSKTPVRPKRGDGYVLKAALFLHEVREQMMRNSHQVREPRKCCEGRAGGKGRAKTKGHLLFMLAGLPSHSKTTNKGVPSTPSLSLQPVTSLLTVIQMPLWNGCPWLKQLLEESLVSRLEQFQVCYDVLSCRMWNTRVSRKLRANLKPTGLEGRNVSHIIHLHFRLCSEILYDWELSKIAHPPKTIMPSTGKHIPCSSQDS